MANDKPTMFRVHFRYNTPGGVQKQTFDVAAEDPTDAQNKVRRAHPGKTLFIDKCKVIKENNA